MVRSSFILIALFSLIYGLVFLLIPNYFVQLSQAEPVNVAWLRNIGASISGVLCVGLFLVYLNPAKNYDLFLIITLTSILQTISLIFSRFYNEFSAHKIIIIDLTIYSAIIVSLYLIYILLNYTSIFKK